MLYFIVYLIGFVLSYLVLKAATEGEWTVRDRTHALMAACLSWLLLLVTLILTIRILFEKNGDKPAKW